MRKTRCRNIFNFWEHKEAFLLLKILLFSLKFLPAQMINFLYRKSLKITYLVTKFCYENAQVGDLPTATQYLARVILPNTTNMPPANYEP